VIQQVAVFDKSGAQVGKTFPKRAKQLVSKQRALWHNDEHTAIFLLPEDDNPEATMKELEVEATTESDDLLLYIARKNVSQRRNLIKHVVVYLIALLVLTVIYFNFIESAQHPRYRTIRTAIRVLDNSPPTSSVNETSHFLNTMLVTYSPPDWYYVRGLTTAWSIYIFVRVVRYATRNLNFSGFRKTKRDPVKQEYYRLKGMVSDGMVVAK